MLRDPNIVGPKNNYSATAEPTVNNDQTQGYGIGSHWIDTSSEKLFICFDATTGAAVWNSAGGATVDVKTADPTVNDDDTQGYEPGSMWLNTANQTLWACIDASTGAAVWRNTTDLAHLYPYVVGPVGLAPYQTIQSAIDQAVIDGMSPSNRKQVVVMPGTYAENLTLHPGLMLVSSEDQSGSFTGSGSANLGVSISGTVSFTNTLSMPPEGSSITLRGLRIGAPSGSSPLNISSTIYAIVLPMIQHCSLVADSADAVSVTPTSGMILPVFDHTSFYISTSGQTLRAVAGVTATFHTCQLRSTSRSVIVAGGSVTLYSDEPGNFNDNAYVDRPVEIETATSGNGLVLSGVYFNLSGSSVIVNGTMAAGAFYSHCMDADRKSITVSGANANQFVEAPLANSGDIWQYDGYRWQTVPISTAAAPAESQILYVGKHGSDLNNGTAVGRAFLTIGAAVAAAGTPASEAAAVTIEVLDDGEYIEDITGVRYVNIHAPNARIVSTTAGHTIADDSQWTFRSMHSTGDRILQKSSTGNSYLRAGHITRVGTNNRPIDITGGTLHVDIGHVSGTSGIAGIAASATDAKIVGRIGTAESLSGSSTFFLAFSGGAGDAEIDVTIERAVTTAALWLAVAANISTGDAIVRVKFGTVLGHATALSTSRSGTGSCQIYAEGERLNAPTAYSIDSGSVLRLIVGDLVGTEAAYAGSNIRVTKAIRNEFAATTDPTANDDSTDGFTVGSQWINVTTDKVFICTDASATAAIWESAQGGIMTKQNRRMAVLTTIGDGAKASNTAVALQPITGALVRVFVNGAEVYVADGLIEKTAKPCFFSPDGITVRNSDGVQAGDFLYWNGSKAGFELAAGIDLLDFVYEV